MIAKPMIKKEAVTLPSLGFDVVVRQLLLSEKLAFQRWIAESEDGEVPEEKLVELLAGVVSGDDGKPLFTFEEWQAHGAYHIDEVALLLSTMFKLSRVPDAGKGDAPQSSSSPES